MRHRIPRRAVRGLVAPWELMDATLVAREDPDRDVAPPGTDLLAEDRRQRREQQEATDTLNIGQL